MRELISVEVEDDSLLFRLQGDRSHRLGGLVASRAAPALDRILSRLAAFYPQELEAASKLSLPQYSP